MNITPADTSVVYDYSAIISENIRARAAALGYNQTKLAKALNVAIPTVSLRWKDKRDWPLDDIAKVATIFGTTPWELSQPSREYEESHTLGVAPKELPQLDSNQQPFDWLFLQVRSFVEVLYWKVRDFLS